MLKILRCLLRLDFSLRRSLFPNLPVFQKETFTYTIHNFPAYKMVYCNINTRGGPSVIYLCIYLHTYHASIHNLPVYQITWIPDGFLNLPENYITWIPDGFLNLPAYHKTWIPDGFLNLPAYHKTWKMVSLIYLRNI